MIDSKSQSSMHGREWETNIKSHEIQGVWVDMYCDKLHNMYCTNSAHKHILISGNCHIIGFQVGPWLFMSLWLIHDASIHRKCN